MAVLDTFSKRQARLNGNVPDVYVYDELSQPLRVQIFQTIEDGIGGWYRGGNPNTPAQKTYEMIAKALRHEYGVFDLREGLLRTHSQNNYLDELKQHLLLATPDKALDLVELCCRYMANSVASANGVRTESVTRMDNGVREINTRFREHGVGYEFTNGEIIRIDSQLVHVEAVKPALALLQNKLYAGAEQELLAAFEHYRGGKTKEALTEALKAIESTIKVICTKRGWTHQPTDTAKNLIEVCLKNGLIPTYWQNHFSSLRAMLEGSVPTARNKTSGHGQGVAIQQVPDYLASYVLHMTASTIVFLVKAEQGLP